MQGTVMVRQSMLRCICPYSQFQSPPGRSPLLRTLKSTHIGGFLSWESYAVCAWDHLNHMRVRQERLDPLPEVEESRDVR